MRRFFLVTSAALVTTLPATACLNDRTLVGSEREFRSQYQTTAPLPRPADPTPRYPSYTLGLVAGGALAVAAVALTVRRSPAA